MQWCGMVPYWFLTVDLMLCCDLIMLLDSWDSLQVLTLENMRHNKGLQDGKQ